MGIWHWLGIDVLLGCELFIMGRLLCMFYRWRLFKDSALLVSFYNLITLHTFM